MSAAQFHRECNFRTFFLYVHACRRNHGTATCFERFRQNQTGFGSTDINNQFDFNRDSKVNLIDIAIARQNQSGFNPVKLITPSSSSGFMEFQSGDHSSHESNNNHTTDFGYTNNINSTVDLPTGPVMLNSRRSDLRLSLRDSFIESFSAIDPVGDQRKSTTKDKEKSLDSAMENSFLTIDMEFSKPDRLIPTMFDE